jgi:hypothetical protein
MLVSWTFLLLQGLWTSVATDVLAFLSVMSGILLMLHASLGSAEGRGFAKRRFLTGFAIAFVGLLVSAVLRIVVFWLPIPCTSPRAYGITRSP